MQTNPMPSPTAFIFALTGEYKILSKAHLFKENYLSFDGTEYDSVFSTPNPTNLDDAWDTIQSLISEYKELNHMGDDDYFDNFPDLLNQYLQLAFQKSHEDYCLALDKIHSDTFILEQYSETSEEPLDNLLCSSDYLEELFYTFNNPNTPKTITMAHTPNMQILSFLLQNPEILEFTDPEIQATIDALPPLNSFTTGDAPKAFLYDATEGIICYADPENPEIQETLSDFSEPSLQFPNIAIYQVG